MEISDRVQLLESLRNEDIESFAADVRDMPKDTALDIRLIGGQPPHLYARAGYLLAGCTHMLRGAWEYGIAVPKPLSPSKVELATLLGLLADREISIVLECDSYGVLKTVALTMDTVLSATDTAVREELENGTLVRPAVKGRFLPSLTTGTMRLYGRTASSVTQTVVAAIVWAAQGINV